MKIIWWLSYLPIIRQLAGCKNVLDLGCGRSSVIQFLNIPYSVGVDVYKPYLLESRAKQIHSDYLLADMKQLEFKHKSFDAVIAIDSLDYAGGKQEGYKLISKMEESARKKVIIRLPSILFPRHLCGGYDSASRPQCVYTVGELKALGFKVRGALGLRILFMQSLKFKWGGARILLKLLTALTNPLTYYFPQLDILFLAVKVVEHTKPKPLSR